MNRRSGNPARRVQSTGLKIEAKHRYHGTIPALPTGEHLWTAVGLWRLTNPAAERFELDIENLLTIEGPGCYLCEQVYSPDIAARPCPGDPS